MGDTLQHLSMYCVPHFINVCAGITSNADGETVPIDVTDSD